MVTPPWPALPHDRCGLGRRRGAAAGPAGAGHARAAPRPVRRLRRRRAGGPPRGDLDARLPVVLQVLYLVFNEGYTATSGENLQRVELTAEAIRLARAVHALLPGDGEVAGLLALMLLTEARRDARIGDDGELVPLPEQDRGRWDAALIAEGEALVDAVLGRTALGPYQ